MVLIARPNWRESRWVVRKRNRLSALSANLVRTSTSCFDFSSSLFTLINIPPELDHSTATSQERTNTTVDLFFGISSYLFTYNLNPAAEFHDACILSVIMTSPFPVSSSSPGEGQIVVEILPHGISALSKITFQYPLKLISPSPAAGQKSVLVFLLTYGGGLVGGDQVHLTIDVRPDGKLSIVTQGHTKIFKSPTRDVITKQRLHVTLQENAALCFLPDPVQPFEGSVYQQSQTFTLANTASLCLLDWVSAGRTARGEDWDLSAWSGRNEVWALAEPGGKPRLLLRDNVILAGDLADSKDKGLRKKMQQMGIFGTLVLRGPLVEGLAAFILNEFATIPRIGARDFRSQDKMNEDSEITLSLDEKWRQARLAQEKADTVLWSAARLRDCTVVKFGARTVEGGRVFIGNLIKQEGSIIQIFGEDSILCIR